jgi:TonB family protein
MMSRFLTIACAALLLPGITHAHSEKSAPPHASREAAIELLRQKGILRKERVVSAKWSTDSWLITLRSPKDTVVTWKVDATAHNAAFFSGHNKVAAAIYTCAPRLPAEARLKHLRGEGLFVFHVRPDGTVSRVEIRQSTGHAILDQACVDAFSQWRFIPGSKTEIKIPVTFNGNYAKQSP